MAKTYTVSAPAASVYLATGAVTLLYKGGVLPGASEMREGEAKRLLDGGFVTAGDLVEEAREPVFGADSDPADFTSDQVLAYLATADEAERTRVLEAEAEGKQRKGVLAFEAPTS